MAILQDSPSKPSYKYQRPTLHWLGPRGLSPPSTARYNDSVYGIDSILHPDFRICIVANALASKGHASSGSRATLTFPTTARREGNTVIGRKSAALEAWRNCF